LSLGRAGAQRQVGEQRPILLARQIDNLTASPAQLEAPEQCQLCDRHGDAHLLGYRSRPVRINAVFPMNTTGKSRSPAGFPPGNPSRSRPDAYKAIDAKVSAVRTAAGRASAERRTNMAMITDRIGFVGSQRKTGSRRSPWAVAGAAIGDAVTTLQDWQERARQRRQLLALDDRALQDFGRSRADAACEGYKPFWRA
jgi:uncharacterized protein YjiS (DUF1127 family)